MHPCLAYISNTVTWAGLSISDTEYRANTPGVDFELSGIDLDFGHAHIRVMRFIGDRSTTQS